MKKIIYSLLILTLFFTVSCTEEITFSSDTEALGDFQITSPVNATSYSLNSGTPDKTIVFSWSEAQPGVSKEVTYTLEMFKVDEETSFMNYTSDNEGKANTATISFTDLNSALENAGLAPGETTTIQWQVIATNNDVEVKTGKTSINLTRFDDNGIVAFNLLAPSNNNVIKADIYGTPNEEVAFTWEKATTTSANGTIKYTLLFDSLDGDFSSPIKSFDVVSGESFTMTHKEIGQNFESTLNVKWTVKATIDGTEINLNAPVNYINWDVFIINEFYLVGSHNGWDNATATPFVDKGEGAFELQIDLPANAEFKFLPQLGAWDGDWGEDPANPGSIIQDGEQNVKVINAGKYIIKVDFLTLSFSVTEFAAPSALFMVGSHNGWNNADASQEFNTSGNGVFTKMQVFSANDEFKLLPTSGSWDGDWGEDPANLGSVIQDGENNIKVATGGTYTVTIDFNDLSYTIVETPANLYLVGSPNGWDNATAPAFTKLSEGVFEIEQTLTVSDEFKLLPVQGSWDNDWAESSKYPGMIVRDNEVNIKSPGNGTYTITVDYNKGTVTVL